MTYIKGKQLYIDDLDIATLRVQQDILTTGSIMSSGTGSYMTGSLYGSATSAISASYAATASYISGFIASASYSISSSYAPNSGTSSLSISASYVKSASYSDTALSASYAPTTGTSSFSISSSYATNTLLAQTASYAATSSYSQNTISASYSHNSDTASISTSSSYATSASYAKNSDTASLANNVISASYASTASYISTFISSSHSINADTASYIQNAVSASYVSTVISASYALTASYTSGNIVGANPTATIGLINITGSATTFMRSDAAPALNVSISPTMSGNWLFKQNINILSTGSQLQLNYDGNNNTNFTVGSTGNLTITPSGSGGQVSIIASLVVGSGGSNLLIQSSTGANNSLSTNYQYAGSTNNMFRIALGGTTSTSITSGRNYAGAIVTTSPITVPASGNIPFASSLVVLPIGTVTLNTSSSITNTATLYINGSNTQGINNYSLYSLSGINYFGGSVILNSTLTLSGYTVSTLPTPTIGMVVYVTDALSPVALAIVAGGGSSKVPVFYNGSNWIVL